MTTDSSGILGCCGSHILLTRYGKVILITQIIIHIHRYYLVYTHILRKKEKLFVLPVTSVLL